tara:strand:- start:1533 stop:2510 length:978 start_codon:yes stop_codon:yes gene_type:complete
MKYFLLPLFLLLGFTTSAQTTHIVEVGPYMTYTPDVLTIEEGDIVSWVSLGGTHDVNFDINSQTGQSFGNLDEIASASLPVQGAGEMGSITFDNAGTYNYDCSVGSHAAMGMVGSIIVEETETQSLSVEVQDYYYAAAGTEGVAYLEVQNLTNNSLNVIASRSPNQVSETNFMCVGLNCYISTVDVTNAFNIPANSSIDDFAGHVLSMPEESDVIINYCFSVENIPSDSVCVDVKYTSSSAVMNVDNHFIHFSSVYPNPVKDVLFIDSNTPTEFVLYDMLGSQVFKERFTSSSNINVSSFEAGIYFYKLKVKGKETEVQKLIITH